MLIVFLCCVFSNFVFANPLHNDAFIPLDRRSDFIKQITLPSEKPESVETYIPITSDWKLVVATPSVRIWENALPVRPRSLFFRSPPSGMELRQRKSEDQPWKKASKKNA